MPDVDDRDEVARRLLILLVGVTLGALWMHIMLADTEEEKKCSD